MPSSRIQEMFSEVGSRSQIPSQRQLELEALPPEYSARLSRRGVTVKSLDKEYHKTRPNEMCIRDRRRSPPVPAAAVTAVIPA